MAVGDVASGGLRHALHALAHALGDIGHHAAAQGRQPQCHAAAPPSGPASCARWPNRPSPRSRARAAKFTAGGEIPVPSGESCTTGELTTCTTCVTVHRVQGIGVALNFTPDRALGGPDQPARLHRRHRQSTPTTRSRFEPGSFAPAFKTRKMDTTVELPSGATLVSAGLMQQAERAGDQRPARPDEPARSWARCSARATTSARRRNCSSRVTPYIAKPSRRRRRRPAGRRLRRRQRSAGRADGPLQPHLRLSRPGPPQRPRYRGRAGFVVE